MADKVLSVPVVITGISLQDNGGGNPEDAFFVVNALPKPGANDAEWHPSRSTLTFNLRDFSGLKIGGLYSLELHELAPAVPEQTEG